jgi:hypothetical protein
MNESNKNKKWIVFWFNGIRIGSIELNESNWIQVKEQLIYNVIQEDITGTVHLDVLAIKKTNKRNKANHGK